MCMEVGWLAGAYITPSSAAKCDAHLGALQFTAMHAEGWVATVASGVSTIMGF